MATYENLQNLGTISKFVKGDLIVHEGDLIMGELLPVKGAAEEALKCFQAAYRSGGKDAYNHQALKRMNSLKII